MALSYASEKLTNAVVTLATSPSSLQDRLYYAWTACHTLTNTKGFGDTFPTDELAQRFMAWHKSVSWREAEGGEGTVKSTTSQMTDAEARKAAEELWEIFYEVEKAYIIQEHKRG